MAEIVDNAELDEDQQQKLKREFAREYQLITREERLERIAEDIVAHFMGRGVLAKAMVISIDKATTVRMYDKVQKHWKTEIEKLQRELDAADPADKPELEKRLRFFQETDMAVVVSPSQNEIEEFKKKGLDIATHRKRMVRKPIEVQKLRGQIAQKLVRMVRLNRTRMNFLEEFQKMIDEYNAGASNLETLFARLVAFTKRLSEEEKRGIAEQLSEEELVIFDLLTKPDMKLTKAEEVEVKKVARELLETLKKEKLVLDWKKRQTTRAAVRYTVETVLDHLPRVYTPQIYEQKCERVYQHVFDSYTGLLAVCMRTNPRHGWRNLRVENRV